MDKLNLQITDPLLAPQVNSKSPPKVTPLNLSKVTQDLIQQKPYKIVAFAEDIDKKDDNYSADEYNYSDEDNFANNQIDSTLAFEKFKEPIVKNQIPNLEEELKDRKQDQHSKPIDIYLDHCKKFTEQNIVTVKKRQNPYKWQPTDFDSKQIHPKLSDYVKLHHHYSAPKTGLNQIDFKMINQTHEHSDDNEDIDQMNKARQQDKEKKLMKQKQDQDRDKEIKHFNQRTTAKLRIKQMEQDMFSDSTSDDELQGLTDKQKKARKDIKNWRKDLQDTIEQETLKLFIDYVHVENKVHLVVKSWSKYTIHRDQEEKEEQKKPEFSSIIVTDTNASIASESIVRGANLSQQDHPYEQKQEKKGKQSMQSSVNQKQSARSKGTHTSHTTSQPSSQIPNDEDFDFMYIKSIKIYNEQLDLVKEILAEQVIPSKSKGEQERDKTYNVSTLYFKDNLYYFKRFFSHEGNQLRLYKCDMSVKGNFAEKPMEGYVFQENLHEQFNPVFAIKVDDTIKQQQTCEIDNTTMESDFLKNQIVLLQLYQDNVFAMKDNIESSKDLNKMYQIYKLENIQKPMQLDREQELNKCKDRLFDYFQNSVEYIIEIKNYSNTKTVIDENQGTKYLIALQDRMVIYEIIKSNPSTCNIYHNHISLYRQLISGIQIQSKQLELYDTSDNPYNQLQYFIVDSENQIQLLYPQEEIKPKQAKIIEQISSQANIPYKSGEHYKRIQKYSDQTTEILNMFHSFDDLKKLLPENLGIKEISDDYNYGEDSVNQMLTIIDSKSNVLENSRTLKIIKMKQEYCNCCMDNKTINCTDKKPALQMFNNLSSVLLQSVKQQQLALTNDIEFKAKKSYKKTKQEINQISHEVIEQVLQIEDIKVQVKLNIKEDIASNRAINKKDFPAQAKSHRITSRKGDCINIKDFQGRDQQVKIDSFLNQKQKFKNNKEFEKIDLKIVQYTKSPDKKTVFIFSIIVTAQKGENSPKYKKRGYFIVSKSNETMISILEGKKDLLQKGDQVDLIIGMNDNEEIELKPYPIDQVSSLFLGKNWIDQGNYTIREKNPTNKQDDLSIIKDIQLSFTTVQEEIQTNTFIPIVYQEKENLKNNRLIIYNILENKFTNMEQINPTLPNQKLMYTDKDGYKCYSFTLTSDIMPQSRIGESPESESKKYTRYAKFSLFTFFSEKLGRIQVQDFQMCAKKEQINISLVGQKQILLSNEFIQSCDFDFLTKSQAIPFYHDDKIKGCQLIFSKSKRETKKEGLGKFLNYQEKLSNNISIMNLLDYEDLNNLYKYESEVVFFGNTTFDLDSDNVKNNAKVISAMLKQTFIDSNVFENQEAFLILRKITDKSMGMRIPDLNYIFLNNFEDIKEKDFFQNQELLNGKSICDICLGDPIAVTKAVEKWDKFDKVCTGSLIDQISKGDKVRKDIFTNVGFYQEILILQQDFNFVTTIQRGIHQNLLKSLIVLIEYIFENINSSKYNELIMFDLPLIIKSTKLDINQFFSRSISESKNKGQNALCNIETVFNEVELPVFSDMQTEYIVVDKFRNPHNIQDDLVEMITQRQKFKEQTSLNYEVEHFYINFTTLIIGEKMRKHLGHYQEEDASKEYRLDQNTLAEYMLLEDEAKIDFYKQETVQRIIDYQWKVTKRLYATLFFIYVSMFVAPYCIIILNPQKSHTEINHTLLKICCIPQYILFLIETTQMYKLKLHYFVGWNITDFLQFVVFQIYVQFKFQGVDETSGYFPELKLLIVLMAFAKILFFIRIFERFGFLINMIRYCLLDLLPFICCFVTFLCVFSICFIVLNMEIDPEVDDAHGLSFFQKTVLQTFRTSIGELGMPTYQKILDRPDSHSKSLNIGMIWMIWYIQTFMMLVVMLNFIIAVITSTYGRVQSQQKLIGFKHKADLNQECYELLNIVSIFTPPQSIKLLVFSNSKDVSCLEDDPITEISADLKKHISKENKTLVANHSNIEKQMKEVFKNQTSLQIQLQTLSQKIDTKHSELNGKLEEFRGEFKQNLQNKQ